MIDFLRNYMYDLGMIENNIRKIRRARGMTLEQLAAALNMTQPSVTRIETGAQPMTLERVVEFANALSCCPADILPGAWGVGFDADRFVRIWDAVTRAIRSKRRVVSERKKMQFVISMYINGCGMSDNVAANDNEVADQIASLQNMVA